MAAAPVKSGTLTAGTATSVDVTGAGDGVWIYNRSQSGTIFVRGDATDATVAGDGCWPVLSRRFLPRRVLTLSGTTATVSLISSAALDYSVEANSEGGPE